MPWFRAGLSGVLVLFGVLAAIPYALRGGPLVALVLAALALAAAFGLARASAAKGAAPWWGIGLLVALPAALGGAVLGQTIAVDAGETLALLGGALLLVLAGLAGARSGRRLTPAAA